MSFVNTFSLIMMLKKLLTFINNVDSQDDTVYHVRKRSVAVLSTKPARLKSAE